MFKIFTYVTNLKHFVQLDYFATRVVVQVQAGEGHFSGPMFPPGLAWTEVRGEPSSFFWLSFFTVQDKQVT